MNTALVTPNLSGYEVTWAYNGATGREFINATSQGAAEREMRASSSNAFAVHATITVKPAPLTWNDDNGCD